MFLTILDQFSIYVAVQSIRLNGGSFMKEREIREAIKKLVENGNHTLKLIGNGNKTTISQFIKEYNAWYSEALPLVRNLLSDRLIEFVSFYKATKTSSNDELPPFNYSIEDYISRANYLAAFGINDPKAFHVASNVTKAKFSSQISIVESVGIRLDSILVDVKGVLQADLFDSELDASRELKRNGHLRPSGLVAGVVLEGHLKKVCLEHSLNVGVNPTISTLNNLLKNNSVIDVPEWRRIQHLGDLRNLCVHSGKREPIDEDVRDLIDGVDRVIKTLF
jgi:hypothetical protein